MQKSNPQRLIFIQTSSSKNLRRDPRHGMRRWACRPYMGDMNTPCHLDITSQISFAHDSLRCRHPILAVIGSGIYVAAPRKADRIMPAAGGAAVTATRRWLM